MGGDDAINSASIALMNNDLTLPFRIRLLTILIQNLIGVYTWSPRCSRDGPTRPWRPSSTLVVRS
jgi:hypothetical protein